MKNTIKDSFILKMIATILLPLFIILVIINSIAVTYAVAYPEIKENISFYDTQAFTDVYTNELYSTMRNRRSQEKLTKQAIESTNNEVYQQYSELGMEISSYHEPVKEGEYYIYYSYYNSNNFKYILIDNENHIVYTNFEQTIKTDTVEKMKNEILKLKKYWIAEENEIKTNITNLSQDEIKYNQMYQYIQQDETYSIYTAYDANMQDDNRITAQSIIFDIASRTYSMAYILLPISIVASILLSLYLLFAVGYKKGEEGIYLDAYNKLPLGLAIFLDIIIGSILTLLIMGGFLISTRDVQLGITLTIIASYFSILIGIYMVEDILKRIKSGTFFKNSITYRFCHWIKTNLKGTFESLTYNKTRTTKVTVVLIGLAFVTMFLTALMFTEMGFFAFLLLAIFLIWSYSKIMKTIKQYNVIEEALKNIYEGKKGTTIEEEKLNQDFQKIAMYINDISGGFANAIEENLKSERLKTELITNVSHDIKTPLTSIINYVDLLKKEEMPNEKAQEYLEILDNKSQRLKKLTEDLVEASKASSGNIKLNMEKLNVKELIKQISGEFEDRFAKRKLQEILTLSEEDIYIMADSRYLYRVLENVYSNIGKYALEASRVYIDTFVEEEKITIQVKNISQDKLNITVEELMQRFVRGDTARNTEGSGLGLSIAQSLTELQGGKFEIYLDGDLFKVTIQFKKV